MSGLVSMAQQFSGLPIKSLIAAPLNAATDANGRMARSQTQFMLSTCFEDDGSDQLKPIMITFKLTRSVIKPDGTAGTPVELQFDLPLSHSTLWPWTTLKFTSRWRSKAPTLVTTKHPKSKKQQPKPTSKQNTTLGCFLLKFTALFLIVLRAHLLRKNIMSHLIRRNMRSTFQPPNFHFPKALQLSSMPSRRMLPQFN